MPFLRQARVLAALVFRSLVFLSQTIIFKPAKSIAEPIFYATSAAFIRDVLRFRFSVSHRLIRAPFPISNLINATLKF